jgi:hypothetical protein
MRFKIAAVETAKIIPADARFPAKRVDHLTVIAESDRKGYAAIQYVDPALPVPPVGAIVEGELGDPDRGEPMRRRFKLRQDAPAAPPMPAPPAFASPSPVPPGLNGGPFAPAARDPSIQRRIERQHSQNMALLYCQLRDDRAITLQGLAELTSWFENDLNPPHPPGRDRAFAVSDVSVRSIGEDAAVVGISTEFEDEATDFDTLPPAREGAW